MANFQLPIPKWRMPKPKATWKLDIGSWSLEIQF